MSKNKTIVFNEELFKEQLLLPDPPNNRIIYYQFENLAKYYLARYMIKTRWPSLDPDDVLSQQIWACQKSIKYYDRSRSAFNYFSKICAKHISSAIKKEASYRAKILINTDIFFQNKDAEAVSNRDIDPLNFTALADNNIYVNALDAIDANISASQDWTSFSRYLQKNYTYKLKPVSWPLFLERFKALNDQWDLFAARLSPQRLKAIKTELTIIAGIPVKKLRVFWDKLADCWSSWKIENK